MYGSEPADGIDPPIILNNINKWSQFILSYFDRAVGSSHCNESSGEFHFENISKNQNVIFFEILSLICSINHLISSCQMTSSQERF